MSQQDQTLQHFRSAAEQWQIQSSHQTGKYDVIEGRKAAVLDVVDRMQGARRFLDVGCGTGQLAIAVAKRGLEAEGIDFAPEMVAKCEANALEAGVTAKFACDSFFNLKFEEGVYDVVSAQGFIEYVSPADTDEFIRRVSRMLRPGGAIALGSRNRLFNVVSFNDYTKLEMESGTLLTLVAESTVLHQNATADAAFRALRRLERIDPQPDRHPITGIPVETRYQYTPADLIARARRFGLEPRTIFPVHYHGLPLAAKGERPELHSQIAWMAKDAWLRDHRLVPFSSTFVLEAQRVI